MDDKLGSRSGYRPVGRAKQQRVGVDLGEGYDRILSRISDGGKLASFRRAFLVDCGCLLGRRLGRWCGMREVASSRLEPEPNVSKAGCVLYRSVVS